MPVGTIVIKLLVRRRQNSSAPSQIYKLESKNPRYSLKLEHIWFTCTAAKACMLQLKAHNRGANQFWALKGIIKDGKWIADI